MAFSVSSVADFFSEGAEQFDAGWKWGLLEIGVQSKHGGELAPTVPIALPFFVSRVHDPIGDGCIRSSEKTRELSLSLNWNSCQEAFCVRAKSWLNFRRNCKSLSL